MTGRGRVRMNGCWLRAGLEWMGLEKLGSGFMIKKILEVKKLLGAPGIATVSSRKQTRVGTV